MELINPCLSCNVFLQHKELSNKDNPLLTIKSESLLEYKNIFPYIPSKYWCENQLFVCLCKVNNAGYDLIVKVEDENINRCTIYPMEPTDSEIPSFKVESKEKA